MNVEALYTTYRVFSSKYMIEDHRIYLCPDFLFLGKSLGQASITPVICPSKANSGQVTYVPISSPSEEIAGPLSHAEQ